MYVISLFLRSITYSFVNIYSSSFVFIYTGLKSLYFLRVSEMKFKEMSDNQQTCLLLLLLRNDDQRPCLVFFFFSIMIISSSLWLCDFSLLFLSCHFLFVHVLYLLFFYFFFCLCVDYSSYYYDLIWCMYDVRCVLREKE